MTEDSRPQCNVVNLLLPPRQFFPGKKIVGNYSQFCYICQIRAFLSTLEYTKEVSKRKYIQHIMQTILPFLVLRRVPYQTVKSKLEFFTIAETIYLEMYLLVAFTVQIDQMYSSLNGNQAQVHQFFSSNVFIARPRGTLLSVPKKISVPQTSVS